MKILKRLSSLLLLMGIILFLNQCKKADDPKSNALHVVSFSPETGAAGTEVVITGENFSSVLSEDRVTINNVNAPISTATTTSLTIIVPYAATTGKLSITVNGVTVTSVPNFVVPVPRIDSFLPVYGLPGDTITITGTNFVSSNPQLNVVTINNLEAQITTAIATQLTVIVPDSAKTGKIKITLGAQSDTSALDFEVLIDIPRKGLLAFLPFTGNARDTSGNRLNGTMPVNGPTLSADRFGKANQAYTFDGINDYITLGNPSLLQINDHITIAGWFNFNSLTANGYFLFTKIFFDSTKGNNPERGYTVSQAGATATPYFALYSYNADGSAFAFNSIIPGAMPTLNTWTFIAVVMDGTAVKWYQDGVFKLNTTTSGGPALVDGTLGNFDIGAYDGGFLFNGAIDDITIYNRGLSDTEIHQLYIQTITKY